MDDLPHIALPIQILGSAFATNQEGTNDEVAACVAAIVAFPLASRDEAPDFGIADPTFSVRPIDTTEIEEAVETWEPRASVEITEAPYDPSDPTAAELQIAVQVFASEDD